MVNCLFCEIVSVAGLLFGLAGICMWAKHSRTKLSKTQAGLHPFSPSVESWSCVALPMVRRVARHGVWHVSGANPRLFATRRPKPTLTSTRTFTMSTTTTTTTLATRPPLPDDHPTSLQRRPQSFHLLPFPTITVGRTEGGGRAMASRECWKVSVRLISPLQRLHCNRTHRFLTLYRNQTTCFDVRLKHVPWCSCSTAYRRRRCGPWEVQSSKTNQVGLYAPSAPPVDSDQNQATGCQPARPAHPRMQAGGHHCVVHPWSRSRSTSMPSPKVDTSQTLRLGLHPLASRAS